jgi:hypothetical protein
MSLQISCVRKAVARLPQTESHLAGPSQVPACPATAPRHPAPLTSRLCPHAGGVPAAPAAAEHPARPLPPRAAARSAGHAGQSCCLPWSTSLRSMHPTTVAVVCRGCMGPTPALRNAFMKSIPGPAVHYPSEQHGSDPWHTLHPCPSSSRPATLHPKEQWEQLGGCAEGTLSSLLWWCCHQPWLPSSAARQLPPPGCSCEDVEVRPALHASVAARLDACKQRSVPEQHSTSSTDAPERCAQDCGPLHASSQQ